MFFSAFETYEYDIWVELHIYNVYIKILQNNKCTPNCIITEKIEIIIAFYSKENNLENKIGLSMQLRTSQNYNLVFFSFYILACYFAVIIFL